MLSELLACQVSEHFLHTQTKCFIWLQVSQSQLLQLPAVLKSACSNMWYQNGPYSQSLAIRLCFVLVFLSDIKSMPAIDIMRECKPAETHPKYNFASHILHTLAYTPSSSSLGTFSATFDAAAPQHT